MPNILDEEKITPISPPLDFKPLDKKGVEEEAKKLREARELPKPPGKTLDWETGVKYLNLLTPDQWKRLSPYMYRLFPVINREPKYIDVFPGPFTWDQVKVKHGGGRYKIIVKDVDSTKRKYDDSFFEIEFEIPLVDCDPILNYEELDLNAMKNRSYIDNLKARHILDASGRPFSGGNGNNSNPNDLSSFMLKEMFSKFMNMNTEQQNAIRAGMRTDDTAMAKALDLVQKTGERGMDLILEKAKQEDPMKLANMFLTLFDKMGNKAGNENNANDKYIMMMMTMMQENAKVVQASSASQNQLLMELLKMEKEKNEQKEVEKGDEFGTVEKVLKLAEMLGLRRGNPLSEGEGEGLWGKLIEVAPQGLAVLNNIIMAAMNRPSQNFVGNQPINNQGGAERTGYLARGINQNYNPPPIQNEVVRNPEVVTTQPIQNPSNFQQFQTANKQIVEMQKTNQPIQNQTLNQPQNQNLDISLYTNFVYTAMIQNTPGYEFAISVTNMIGREKYLEVTRLGEENLTGMFKASPENWNRLINMFGEEKVKKFVHEFVHSDEIIEKMENEEEMEEEEK
jgi:hypothetical protein